jgi:hypothetical protein
MSPSPTTGSALALAVLGLLLAGIAAWLAFGIDHATLEFLRRDLPFGWMLAQGIPAAALSVGLLALAAWLAAGWLRSRARRT